MRSFRLSDQDRETYGGPEWVTFEVDDLYKVPLETLESIEAEFRKHNDITLAVMLALEVRDNSLLGLRAAVWIARKLAGHTESWPEFRPNPLAMKTILGGGSVPPAQSSSEPSSAPPKAPAAKKSSRRSPKG